jgi:hypothetical protein
LQLLSRQQLGSAIEMLRPIVDAHATKERVRLYLSRLCNTPAPSARQKGSGGQRADTTATTTRAMSKAGVSWTT